ncbi:hypothetical protein F5Y17DRAFT_89068 [Xylariaceae sp. FL0594]|nr:hypothetical protein F5Y17DRAFT_89068 [Xylariaceae sp. FL0594]
MSAERPTAVGRFARKNSLLSSALRFLGYDVSPDIASAPRIAATEPTVATLSGGRYADVLPVDVEPIRALLTGYSGIPAEDVDQHVYQMRDRLWDIYPYSCVGRFRFASLEFASDGYYQAALSRLLQAGTDPDDQTRFLDVGCCVGQVLRKLAFDGVDSSRLYGTDVEPRFLDLGYDLFRDRDKFRGTFVIGDFLRPLTREDGEDETPGLLDQLVGKMTFIHANSFFHLFTWDDQVRAATRMVRLLDPKSPDVMVFGRHVGTLMPRPRGNGKAGSDTVYLHNEETWQALWNEVGQLTDTRWKVAMEPIEKVDVGAASLESAMRKMSFCVKRA